jgi:hypothetical protein
MSDVRKGEEWGVIYLKEKLNDEIVDRMEIGKE